ncbi:putative cuticle protein, partial [Operophtera brumata]
ILVLAVSVVIASCSDHHYVLKQSPQHESHKEYRHPYEHQIQVQEPSSEEYKPENHGHAYSSQSIVHQGQTAAYEESHESNTEHVAPVYQYQVDEQNEEAAPVQHNTPVQHNYRPVHYPAQEIQTIRVPAHHKTAYYHPESHESHEAHRVPAYHHPESHEVLHKVPAYYQHESHEVQQHKAHHYQPEAHEVPVYHHATPEHHASVQTDSHDSHDEPIDYYAYPKYQYEYKVDDPHTGDNKFQHEFRDGDVVKGVYGLREADGSIRTVEYSSDKHHGFSAIVKHSAPGQHVHIETHHQNDHENDHQNDHQN